MQYFKFDILQYSIGLYEPSQLQIVHGVWHYIYTYQSVKFRFEDDGHLFQLVLSVIVIRRFFLKYLNVRCLLPLKHLWKFSYEVKSNYAAM